MKTKSAIAALAALAQESRLAVFRALVRAGPAGLSAGTLAKGASISPSALSFHLKELAHADMVSARPDGRFIIYVANFAAMNGLVAFLTENCCGGNPCTPVRVPVCSTRKKETT